MAMAKLSFPKLTFSGKGLKQLFKSIPAERLWLLWWPLVMSILVFCGYYLHSAVEKLEKDLRYARAAADWTQIISNEARQLKLGQAQQRPMDALAARQAVEASLQKLKLPMAEIKIDSSKPSLIELTFNNVHFNTWIRWVEVLFNDSRIALKSAQAVQLGQGVAKIEVKLIY